MRVPARFFTLVPIVTKTELTVCSPKRSPFLAFSSYEFFLNGVNFPFKKKRYLSETMCRAFAVPRMDVVRKTDTFPTPRSGMLCGALIRQKALSPWIMQV
jgi:hypothetical protein